MSARRASWPIAIVLAGLVMACAAASPESSSRAGTFETRGERGRVERPGSNAIEVRPRFLPLPAWLEPSESMISGLTWFGDRLVLLPQQRPVDGVRSAHRGKLYTIPRAAIERAIEAPGDDPLPVETWSLEAPGIDSLPGFEGFEAIAFDRDRVYATVEADVEGRPHAWLLSGRADSRERTIRFEAPTIHVVGRSGIENLTEEAMLVHRDATIVIHEANGRAVNGDPVAHVYRPSNEGSPLLELPMAAVEYRVTDATQVDSQGRFWVMNYLWEGDSVLMTPDDLLGGPPEGSRSAAVPWLERAVELRLTSGGIVPTGRPPVYLEPGPVARNWEGVARFGPEGLLAVTDKYPATRLAFIPLSAAPVR